MKVSEAREIGRTAREYIRRDEPRLVLNLLLPVVQARTSFRMLGEIGQELAFLEPSFSEWDLPAAKGIAWGLKTLGRYYPQETGDWLRRQLGRRHRTLMRKKALTYLPPDLRAAVQRSKGA